MHPAGLIMHPAGFEQGGTIGTKGSATLKKVMRWPLGFEDLLPCQPMYTEHVILLGMSFF